MMANISASARIQILYEQSSRWMLGGSGIVRDRCCGVARWDSVLDLMGFGESSSSVGHAVAFGLEYLVNV